MARKIEELVAEHGALAVIDALEPFVTNERKARIDAVLNARLQGLTTVFENLHDPHNGAAAVRSIEAFGLAEVHAVETVEPFRLDKGITIGCQQWISLHRYNNLDSCVEVLRGAGMAICATLPGATQTIEDLDPIKPRALIFGNEHDGLSAQAQAVADEHVRIPMYGFTQSFNLSVSVALLVERAASHRRRGLGREGDLELHRQQELRAQWYSFAIRGFAGIIRRHVSK